MVSIAISNHKGGVGKTTTAIELAIGMAQAGYRVLLIDLDPQGHSTLGLGIDMDEAAQDRPSIATVFIEKRVLLDEVMMDTFEPNLKLIPADTRLEKAAKMLYTRPAPAMLLRIALDKLTGFDYVLIDCQPSLQALTQNALAACNKVIIPTQLEWFSLRGIGDLLETKEEMDDIKSQLQSHQGASDWRILLTMVSGHGQERKEAAWKVLEPMKDRILKTQIRRRESIARGQMIKKDGVRAFPDYTDLVREILDLWPVQKN